MFQDKNFQMSKEGNIYIDQILLWRIFCVSCFDKYINQRENYNEKYKNYKNINKMQLMKHNYGVLSVTKRIDFIRKSGVGKKMTDFMFA